MNESSNVKECDHLSNNFAIGNDGIYYCTMCDKNHNWVNNEPMTTEQCFCQSYFDGYDTLKDCTCGKCK